MSIEVIKPGLQSSFKIEGEHGLYCTWAVGQGGAHDPYQ